MEGQRQGDGGGRRATQGWDGASVDPNDIKRTDKISDDDWDDDDFLDDGSHRPTVDLTQLDPEEVLGKANAEDLAFLKPPPTPGRLALMAGVVLATAWYVYGQADELRYFFSGSTPQDLGDALDLGAQPCADGLPCVPALEAIPSNTFVRVTGLPTREVPASDIKIGTKKATQVFFQMQNSPIWVQEGADAYVARIKAKAGEGTLEDPIYQESVVAEGRFINLRDDADNLYMSMRKAYTEFYPLHVGHFCMDLQPQTIKRLESERAQGGQIIALTQDITKLQKRPPVTSALLHGVDLNDAGVGYAVGEGGTVIKTSDAGQTWRPLASGAGDVILRDVAFTPDAQRGVVVGDGGVMLRTDDGGLRFSPVKGADLSHHINAVAISPDGLDVVAAGSEGLMLHSEDGGQTWTPRPTLKRPDLKDIVRTAAGTLVACGEQGAILRSTDGGQTWAWMVSDTVTDLEDVTLSTDGARLLIVGEKGTALRSDDDGLTWTAAQLHHIPGVPAEEVSADRYRYLSLADFHAAAWHPDGQQVLFVGEQGALAVSRDGGQTIKLRSDAYATGLMLEHLQDGRGLQAGLWAVWQQHTLSRLNAVAWTGPATALAVGQGGACLTTDDAGNSWRRCTLPTHLFAAHAAVKDIARGEPLPSVLAAAVKQHAAPDLNAVAFNARGQGWVVGDNGLTLSTSDAGKTWRAQRATSRHIYSIQLSAGGDLALFSGSSGLWGYIDARGGDARFLDLTTRDAAPRPRDTLFYRAVASLHPLGLPQGPDAPDWVIPTPDELDPVLIGPDLLITGYSQSRAEHFLRLKPVAAQPRSLAIATADTPMTPEVMSVTLTPSRLAIAAGDNGQLLRSADGGRSFIPTPSGVTQSLRAVTISADGLLAFAGGDGVLLRGSRLLRRWSLVQTPERLQGAAISALALDPADPKRLLVAAGATLWLSEDDAATFTVAYEGALPLSALALDPTSGAVIAAGDGGLVLISADRGRTWTPRPKPSDAAITSAWIADALALITTADGAVWRSADQGQTWALAAPPLGVPLRGVAAHPPTQTAWAAAADGRRLRSADLGQTWEALPALTTTPLSALAMNALTGQVWLVGADQTVFSSSDGDRWSLLPIIHAWEWQGKWGRFTAKLPSDIHGVTFTTTNPITGRTNAFAVGGEGLILSSADGGRTWVTRRVGEQEALRDVVFDRAGKLGLAVGLNHKLLWTENSGESWFSEPAEIDTTADFYAASATGKPPITDFTAFGSQGTIVRLRAPRAQVEPTLLPPVPGLESFRAVTLLPDNDGILTVGGDPLPLHDICTPGYLILSEDTPRSNWDDLLYALLIGGFGVFTAVNLVHQWRRRAAMLR
jgi:photosystem II stability/assembly factor-like uncharacterized protein